MGLWDWNKFWSRNGHKSRSMNPFEAFSKCIIILTLNARLNQNSMTAPHCCHLQYPWIFNSKHVLVGMRDEIIIIWIELSPKMHFQSRNLFSRASKEWKKIFLKYFRWNIFWLLVGNPCLFEKGHLEIWGLTLYEIVRTRKSGLSMTTYGKYFRIEFAGDW